MNKLTILCWNIGNPSIERAQSQATWLYSLNHDIYVLTETKNSKGCKYLYDYFKERNFYIEYTIPQGNEYGVMILSKVQIAESLLSKRFDYLSSRVKSVHFDWMGEQYELIGTYVPSNDRKPEKYQRKKEFIEELDKNLSEYTDNRIFCGDLNTVHKTHIPKYTMFREWEYEFLDNLERNNYCDAFSILFNDKQEYSWIGRNGNGYRYDYFFISKNLKDKVKNCVYFHAPVQKELSDHSAVILDIY